MFRLNIRNFPKSTDVYLDLANAFTAKGDKLDARDSYQKAQELSPNNSDIASKLKALSN
jgi:Tfp pilus assembly protein PilF